LIEKPKHGDGRLEAFGGRAGEEVAVEVELRGLDELDLLPLAVTGMSAPNWGSSREWRGTVVAATTSKRSAGASPGSQEGERREERRAAVHWRLRPRSLGATDLPRFLFAPSTFRDARRKSLRDSAARAAP
jgi:hypothetical protein